MSTLEEIIITATKIVENGGLITGFLLIILEAFLPVLPLGAFVTLNVNAFGLYLGLTISWIASVLGSFIMYLLCYYISNKYIYSINWNKTSSSKFIFLFTITIINFWRVYNLTLI